MKDHVYNLNKWSHAQALTAAQENETLKQARTTNNAESDIASEPEPEDQNVRRFLQARQARLHTLGNSEVLIQQARANLLRQASAEIDAVMNELNGVHRTKQKLGETTTEATASIQEIKCEYWIKI